MKNISTDFLIVGGGIIGTSLARALKKAAPTSKIILLEKENTLGIHQTTNNSGVLHAGIYYDQGTLKSKLCVKGNKMMHQYCEDNKLPLLKCGKLIVAKHENEVQRIHEFYQKALNNGAYVELVNETQARSLEPRLSKELKYPMIWSPNSSSADRVPIIRQLESDAKSVNVEIRTNEGYKKLLNCSDDSVTIQTTQNNTISAGKMINCAGLYAEKIAQDFGEAKDYILLPLKGIFLEDSLTWQQVNLRTHVYPLPPMNRCFSYLGLHTTIYPNGTVKLGPTGIPAFWREHYSGFERFNPSEMYNIVGSYIGALISKQGKGYSSEMLKQFKNYQTKNIVKEGCKLVDAYEEINESNIKQRLKRKRPGIQAQLINSKTSELVDDFEFINKKSHFHALNIASPGWTSSLAIADYATDLIINSKKD